MKRKTLLLNAATLILLGAAPVATAQSNWPIFNGKTQSGDAMTIDPARGVLTMAPLLERTTPAVVNISVSSTVKVPANRSRNDEFIERFFGDRIPGFGDRDNDNDNNDDESNERTTRSAGSGVIINAGKGYVLTNHHVVDKADKITVTLTDRRTAEAELIGSDPGIDIALLKIDLNNLTDVPLANSDRTKVGDFVIAIGNPFGIGQTVTSGIVSALDRSTYSRDKYQNYIQTDAAINQGNSGGALINSKGELIGINAAILSRSGGSNGIGNGIGFAVPTNMVTNVMDQLIAYGEVRRGRIGVSIQNITPELMIAMGLNSRDGALVSQVSEDSPAEKAGIQEGDVIVGFNGKKILDSDDIRNAVGYVERGSKADISYIRDGKKITTKIDVEKAPDEEVIPAEDEEESAIEPSSYDAFEGASFSNIPANLDPRGGDEGVVITNIKRGSDAYDAGLRKGDIVRAVNNKQIADLSDFKSAIAGKTKAVALTVQRGRSQIYIAVK
jgi:Do/DeqQ family serine protease